MSFNNYSQFLNNTFHTSGPLALNILKGSKTLAEHNGVPTPKSSSIQPPTNLFEQNEKGILTQLEDDASNKSEESKNESDTFLDDSYITPGKPQASNRKIQTVDASKTPTFADFTTANSKPILITPRSNKPGLKNLLVKQRTTAHPALPYNASPMVNHETLHKTNTETNSEKNAETTIKTQIVATKTTNMGNETNNESEPKLIDIEPNIDQVNDTTQNSTESFSNKTDYDLPYPQQTPNSNRKSVNLEPELEPLCTLIMSQHEVFTPHFIELGNISLTLSKDISKKKENYSLLKDNKKYPEA